MTCPIGTDVAYAAGKLRGGGLVAFPTETVYGLGADALNIDAVARVFEVKARPRFDPLIVHVAELSWLDCLVADLPESARHLAEECWPGPLTLVLPKTEAVPDLVTAGLPTVAVRIPDHPLALELLQEVDCPIAAPSANPFGQISPTRAEHVAAQLGDKIDYILDGGPCRVGLESTVLDLTTVQPTILRHGGVSWEQLQTVLGEVADAPVKTCADSEARASPGMLSRHYAPRTPLTIVESFPNAQAGQRLGLLTLRPVADASAYAAVEVLSATGNLTEAATRFFAALRRLDELGLDRIVAVRFPEEQLGRALNDRLQRAERS